VGPQKERALTINVWGVGSAGVYRLVRSDCEMLRIGTIIGISMGYSWVIPG